MKLLDRQVIYASPAAGVAAYAHSGYTGAQGLDKILCRSSMTRSDTMDSFELCFSSDNGRSWSPPAAMPVMEQLPQGILRRHHRPPWVDRETGRLITLGVEGILPSDNPLEGMMHWTLTYSLSADGGKTSYRQGQIIQQGPYDAAHPCAGVWIGKNAMQIGDRGCRPIRTAAGHLLFPIQITPLGPDGRYHNPGGGLTWHEAAVLIGRWNAGGDLEWDLSQRVANSPERSTRGCIEPTLAQLPDGRIMMVLRGSNDAKPHLPGYKWISFSADQGFTWSPVDPWTDDVGQSVVSPSSMSQLLPHSNGSIFWLGNLCSENPRGNSPRYPIAIARVDPATGRLIRSSVLAVDNRAAGESPNLMLSNFMAHEDRQTGHVLLEMSRSFAKGPRDWTTDAYQYRIAVK